MNKRRVGILISDGTRLLVAHAMGGKRWDIPKGHLEEGETELQGLQREVREETGLIFGRDIIEEKINRIGEFPYLGDTLILFEYKDKMSKLPLTRNMMASQQEIEMDDYKYVLFEDMQKYVYPSLFPILELLVESNLRSK